MCSTEKVRKSLQLAVAVAVCSSVLSLFWEVFFVSFYFLYYLGWGGSHTSTRSLLGIFVLRDAAAVLPHRVQTTQQ